MGPQGRQPRRRRLSREASRRALLDEGLRMVDAQPVGSGLDHIHPATVAANLDLTSGAIYHHWESLDDYRGELLEELLAAGRFGAVSAYDDDAVADLAMHESIAELIVAVTDADWQKVLADHRRLRTNLGLWARNEDDITERLADQYRQLAKGWSGVIQAVLHEFDLEPRPPFTMTAITSVLTAMVEGLAVRATTDRTGVPSTTDPTDEDTSLFSASAAAFLSGAVRRRGETDLWAHVDATIGRST